MEGSASGAGGGFWAEKLNFLPFLAVLEGLAGGRWLFLTSQKRYWGSGLPYFGVRKRHWEAGKRDLGGA